MIQRRMLAAALVLLGTALVASGWTSLLDSLPLSGHADVVLQTIGTMLVAAGLLVMLGSFHPAAERTVLPLNWFLPALRKPRPGMPPTDGAVLRGARRILPASMFSNRATKQRGLVRRGLRWLGRTWLLAPVRRVVQACCFLLFLILFFWVCWPYDARPAAAGATSGGWTLLEIDSNDGSLRFQNASTPEWIAAGEVLYLVDESAPDAGSDSLPPMLVGRSEASEVSLEPAGRLTDDQLDRLLTGGGSWSIHQRPLGSWPTHYADNLASKEFVPADLFLVIDPLVSLSTAIASRQWVWSLLCAAVILIVCLLIPRGFCGYLCPLGTLIDLFDWAIGRRVTRFRLPEEGWWVHVKYYLLLGTLICAACGVLISGYVAAIPVITRGMLFLGEPLQSGPVRGWHLVPSLHAGHLLSIGLFLGVLGLGLLRPRFWCKYVCPSGAVFSLGNLFRVSERKVESSCIHCNKCIEVCPFDAIKPDFTTRVTDCTLCQTCGGVCPTHAIKFVERWNAVELKVTGDPPTGETPIGRRGFLSLAAGTVAAVAGGVGVAKGIDAYGADLDDPQAFLPVRPPGSVPETEFLQMCIRCGECFKACPNNVLQAVGFEQGLAGLWTPQVVADWAGCESSCNACGQVCPTGAIRALPMDEKRVARMGLAIVNQSTCLPYADREACQLCVDECHAAGYDAIEFSRVHTRTDDSGQPIPGSGYLAPVVLAEKCVGCGLCQTRCYGINVKAKHLLRESAIVIEAGAGKEDRLLSGSYRQLRAEEAEHRRQQRDQSGGAEFFVPETTPDAADPVTNPATPGIPSNDPFGLEP